MLGAIEVSTTETGFQGRSRLDTQPSAHQAEPGARSPQANGWSHPAGERQFMAHRPGMSSATGMGPLGGSSRHGDGTTC